MSDELMDCPFCGGKAKVRDASLGAYVFCTKCLCSTAGETNPAKAIAAWNKRAERTCTMERDADGGWSCLACGETLSSWCDSWAPDYCPNCGARVLSEEEQGHMVADAIRRLEKAVER